MSKKRTNFFDFMGYYNPAKLADRGDPLLMIFVAAFITLIVGLIGMFDVLTMIGGIIILIYLVYFFIWIYLKSR